MREILTYIMQPQNMSMMLLPLASQLKVIKAAQLICIHAPTHNAVCVCVCEVWMHNLCSESSDITRVRARSRVCV